MTVARILQGLEAKGLKLAVAESLTGGLLAASIVDTPGASKVFLGGVVAYETSVKAGLLDVPAELLNRVGAVDPEVAQAMAYGVRKSFAEATRCSIESVVGIATTGVAGPDHQDGKPVGLVYIAISGLGDPDAIKLQLSGDRQGIRAGVVDEALEQLASRL